jgi:hypothetical protein
MTDSSWEGFLNDIRRAQQKLKGKPLWYRGHANSDFKLLPSLLRFPDGLSKEKALFARYEQAAIALARDRESSWEMLFDMQHYYIPTRLLDWTEVLGVAVFFAMLKDYGQEPCIYVLDPRALNVMATGFAEIKQRDSEDFDYKKIYWSHNAAVLPRAPVAMEPRFQNRRLQAQKAKFTIHNDDLIPLDEQCPGCVIKVAIPASARDGAKEFLRFANLNEFSMFPEIDGLAPFIKTELEME